MFEIPDGYRTANFASKSGRLLNIGDRAHLARGVDIAGRDGDRTGRDACARLLERRSIRAAALEDFTLRGNAEQLRRLFEAGADPQESR